MLNSALRWFNGIVYNVSLIEEGIDSLNFNMFNWEFQSTVYLLFHEQNVCVIIILFLCIQQIDFEN